MAKWKRSGIVRLSASKKVVNVGIYEQASTKWLIIDVERLLDLIAGKVLEVPIMESERS